MHDNRLLFVDSIDCNSNTYVYLPNLVTVIVRIYGLLFTITNVNDFLDNIYFTYDLKKKKNNISQDNIFTKYYENKIALYFHYILFTTTMFVIFVMCTMIIINNSYLYLLNMSQMRIC